MTARKPRKRPRRGFGAIRQLPSGRIQASFVGPDLTRYAAPTTFATRMDAEAWLAAERRLMDAAGSDWRSPKERAQAHRAGLTLREWGPVAVDRRRVRGEPLKPRTRVLYLSLLERVIDPVLGDLPLAAIHPEHVTEFYEGLPADKPTQRAHAYALLRTILGQGVEDGLITSNPCRVRGAGRTTRARSITVASPAELVTIAEHMPDGLELFVLLAGWCGLRYGELVELRRRDVDLERGALVVSRAVVRVNREFVVGTPKSHAGIRTVAIPPHVLPAVRDHLDRHVAKGPDALLFARPGNRHLDHSETTRAFATARAAAGRADLRVHDLRHTSAVLAALTGATLAELMARLGHSTAAAALRYQSVAQGRDSEIAAALSGLAQAASGDRPDK